MRDNSTLDKAAFIENTFWLSLNSVLVYRLSCFSAIYGVTVWKSKLVFWALVLLLIPLGTYITLADRRNVLSLVVNVMLPLEIYTIASTFRYIPKVHIISLSVAAILSAAYFALIVFYRVKNKKHFFILRM